MLSNAEVARQWVARGWECGPLVDRDRRLVLDRIRQQYRDGGVSCPELVIWADSPWSANVEWTRQFPPPLTRGERIRAAPFRFLMAMVLRSGWFLGHLLAAATTFAVPLGVIIGITYVPPRIVEDRDIVRVVVVVASLFTVGLFKELAYRLVERAFADAGILCASWDTATRQRDHRHELLFEEDLDWAPRLVPGWIGSRSVVVICRRPLILRTEPAGSAGERHLHADHGPAVVWPGTGIDSDEFLHGVHIPGHLCGDPGVEYIHDEDNSELRRLVIERMGWPRYISEAGLKLVAAQPDPGNPGQELRLYDLPWNEYEDGRLLVMVNGSPDRSGRERQYVEVVPSEFDDPIAAAAWQYGCSVETYRHLARRT